MKIKNLLATALFLIFPVMASAVEPAVPKLLPPVEVVTPSVPTAPAAPPVPTPIRPASFQNKSADSARLDQKLAELDRIQKEVDDLRAATHTAPQILVRLLLLEINLTEARKAGFDVSRLFPQLDPVFAGDLLDSKPKPAASDPKTAEPVESIRNKPFVRILANPVLVSLSGRPVTFNVGGEFPIPSPQQNRVEYRQFGTHIDLLATSLGKDKVRISVRPRVSELDTRHTIQMNGTKVPGLSVRECNFTTETVFGQAVAISGMIDRDTDRDGAKIGEPTDVMLAVVVRPEAIDAIAGTPPPTLNRVGDRLFAPPPTR